MRDDNYTAGQKSTWALFLSTATAKWTAIGEHQYEQSSCRRRCGRAQPKISRSSKVSLSLLGMHHKSIACTGRRACLHVVLVGAKNDRLRVMDVLHVRSESLRHSLSIDRTGRASFMSTVGPIRRRVKQQRPPCGVTATRPSPPAKKSNDRIRVSKKALSLNKSNTSDGNLGNGYRDKSECWPQASAIRGTVLCA